MEGVLYLTDEYNNRRYVQIDVDMYGGEYLQDLIEGLVAASRKDEESIPFDDVLKELKMEGSIDG